MNEFTVEWTDVATTQLTELWLGSRQRQRLGEAAEEIESFLRRWPARRAYHLSEGLWQIVVPPLQAFFYIEDPIRTITIDAVKLSP